MASNRVSLWAAPAAVVSLPATNYAVEGIEMNLYYENVIRHNYALGNYGVNATATNGNANAGFYRLVPTAGMAGNMPLSLQVSFLTNVLATWSGVVRCVAATNGTGLTNAVCLIGDSTTAGGQVVAGLYSDAETSGYKLRFLGTQGTAPQQHEGRSGWTLGGFYSGAGSPMTNGAGVFDFNFYA